MARNSMRSGAKGGAWRWTDLLRLCVRARRGREESKMGEDRRERKGEREEGARIRPMFPCGFRADSMRIPRGFHAGSHFPCGSRAVSMRIPCRFRAACNFPCAVSMRFPCGERAKNGQNRCGAALRGRHGGTLAGTMISAARPWRAGTCVRCCTWSAFSRCVRWGAIQAPPFAPLLMWFPRGAGPSALDSRQKSRKIDWF